MKGRGMKKTWLSSTARGLIVAPVATAVPLRIGVAMAGDASVRVTIAAETFVLPDDQDALGVALTAIPDKGRPVVLDVAGMVALPRRVAGGILHLVQSAGFRKVSVVTDPAAG